MLRRVSLVTALAASLLASGCVAPPPGWVPVAYSDAEYAPYLQPGTATVKGQVFAKTRGGDVKKGAGEQVYLMPATSFGEQRYQNEFLMGRRAMLGADPRHAKAVLIKTADGDGKFEFSKVPAGKYYAFSNITWEIPSVVLKGLMETQGGMVVRLIEVKANETTEAILTR